jgi:hypothetical protein
LLLPQHENALAAVTWRETAKCDIYTAALSSQIAETAIKIRTFSDQNGTLAGGRQE